MLLRKKELLRRRPRSNWVGDTGGSFESALNATWRRGEGDEVVWRLLGGGESGVSVSSITALSRLCKVLGCLSASGEMLVLLVLEGASCDKLGRWGKTLSARLPRITSRIVAVYDGIAESLTVLYKNNEQ